MERNKGYLRQPLKSFGYAPYLIYMIERVTARIFLCEKKHHPLRIKNDLRAQVEDTRALTPHSSPSRAARGRGQQRDKPLSPIQNIFSLLFGICKSQHVADVKAQHERRERKKISKSVKEIRAPLVLSLHLRVKKAQRLSSLKKELLNLKIRLRCSSGMEKQASRVSVLTTVACPMHPPLTYLLLIPLLYHKLMMMMMIKRDTT
jgi:hypothetical protein